MKRPTDIDTALSDAHLLGAALGNPASWQTWRTVLKAAFGLALNRDEARAFASVAGDSQATIPTHPRIMGVIGRRGGKSRMAALVAVYLALFCKYKLAAGERGLVLVLAASQEQARIVFGYAKAFLKPPPYYGKKLNQSRVPRSDLKMASPSQFIPTHFEQSEAARFALLYLMKSQCGVTKRQRRPTQKSIPASCPRYLRQMDCWSQFRPPIAASVCFTETPRPLRS